MTHGPLELGLLHIEMTRDRYFIAVEDFKLTSSNYDSLIKEDLVLHENFL